MKRYIAARMIGLLTLLAVLTFRSFGHAEEKAHLAYDSFPDVAMRLQGPMEQRIQNNVTDWIIRAPKANPALLAVFDLRDRQPQSNRYYVPWVGEFIGKFLTNSIMFLRMSDNPELEKTVRILIEELIARQDKDGYLGPFPTQDRLLTAWDLWGHYHAMTALLMWYERTGNQAVFDCTCRAADFICDTFLETGKRMKDVGSHEMNLSIITSLCQVYRLTGTQRYLDMVREIEKDWEDTGDYFRAGLGGREFYRTPRPRWESIHCILGLIELYRITGDRQYRDAFMNLWSSARKLEMHNNGSFSSNEQTVGNPYDPGAIETCCTIAWMAMTVDALRLTGDPECADALEIATFNAAASLQHPSGSWSTYDTPMDGRRESSFHSIVFQSRPGQPELNCCSVNAPRGLGMISEWGVMKGTGKNGNPEVVVHYYGPGDTTLQFPDGNPITLTQTTDYPRDGKIVMTVHSKAPKDFTLTFRIPAWADEATIREPGQSRPVQVPAGKYFAVTRTWKSGDAVELNFPMPLRYESGDLAASGKVSLFRGPLLLAYDQRFNAFEQDDIPKLTPATLKTAIVEIPQRDERAETYGFYTPWLLVTLKGGEHGTTPLVLCDFASAGMLGTTYASWIPAGDIAPPIPACDQPSHGAQVAPGAIRFTWRRMARPKECRLTVAVSDTPDFKNILIQATADDHRSLIMTPEQTKVLKSATAYYWKVVATNDFGQTESLAPGRKFSIAPNLPPREVEDFAVTRIKGFGPNAMLISDDLSGVPNPTTGTLENAAGNAAAAGVDEKDDGSIRLDGQTGMLVYSLPEFPRDDFTLTLDFLLEGFTGRQNSQIVSAWCRAIDDPLRVVVTPNNKLVGTVEGPLSGRTPDISIALNRWYKLAVIKEGEMWSMFLDGKQVGYFRTEETLTTESCAIALGGNPRFTGGSEHAPCRVANFRFYGKAVPLEEIEK